MDMVDSSSERIDSSRIQEIFNNSQELQRLVSENVNRTQLKRKHLKEPREKNLPWCTHSESFRYQNDSETHSVVVHQYTLPDGGIGASGLPDPKRIRIFHMTYYV